MFLLMKFFKASTWRNYHSIQLLGSNNQKVFLSRPFENLGIGNSASASSLESALALVLQKSYFCLQNFFEKIEYLCSSLCLVMASVPLCYQYLFLYGFLYIHSKVSIGYLNNKAIWTFGSIRPLLLWKNNCFENFWILCILSRETSRVEFFLSTLVGSPGIFLTSSLEQLFCRQGFIRAI